VGGDVNGFFFGVGVRCCSFFLWLGVFMVVAICFCWNH
jgi:hypothetical protein